ncbi:MAG: ABC transporter permease [Caldilineaceae bacterium]|nr:ABC transporter permease [Caldilineaceae bacterium]
MGRYLLRRLLQSIPVLIGITIITFTFIELAPGDAVSGLLMTAEGSAGNIDTAALRARYGLDQPAPIRYVRWMGELLQGNMGTRILSGTPVAEEIGRRLPATLQLMVVAVVIAIAIGLPLGVYTALRQYSFADYALTGFVFMGISVPGFFAAIAAVYIFGVRLNWFPTSGYSTPGQNLGPIGQVLDILHHMALPALVLAIESSASIMRYTRASMLDVIRQDYITTARSKGLSPLLITIRHTLRNALLPIITIIGLRLPSLFGGAIVIETIFNWPGMGRLYLDGVTTRDIPLIMGMVLISALVIVVSNLITDLTYAVADPRVRYE